MALRQDQPWAVTPSASSHALTDRELQIVRLAAQGMTDKEMCHQLTLSLPTVRTHWVRLRRKLNVANRSQAVAVVQQGADSTPRDEAADAITMAIRQGVGMWTWQPASKIALLDEQSQQLFRVGHHQSKVFLSSLLDAVWPPDRSRVENYLLQIPRARTMSAIEFRVGPERSYGDIVRTVNLAPANLKRLGPCTLMATRLERSLLM